MRFRFAFSILVVACESPPAKVPDSGIMMPDGGSPDGAMITVDRGPTAIMVDGDPNGLLWDEESKTLIVADDQNNRLLRWTEGTGFSLVAMLPMAPPMGAGLGQVIKLKDGTLVVTRFGFGTAGGVVTVTPQGQAANVPNLDPARRRIGLTLAADGTIYDSFFVTQGMGVRLGTVAKLDVALGTETDVITNIKKPVGVLATNDKLIVTDQDLSQALTSPLSNPSMYTVLAMVTAPDLMSPGPNGSVFTGGSNGEVRQISAAGAVSTFQGGFQSVRGVAYDATNKRLFLAEHDSNPNDGTMNVLHILPVN